MITIEETDLWGSQKPIYAQAPNSFWGEPPGLALGQVTSLPTTPSIRQRLSPCKASQNSGPLECSMNSLELELPPPHPEKLKRSCRRPLQGSLPRTVPSCICVGTCVCVFARLGVRT